MYQPQIEDIKKAAEAITQVSKPTPLLQNINYSQRYDANISFKREDLQIVRSYKIRGAYNKIYNLCEEQRSKGIVCASAGNHAQGVAYSCFKLKIKGTIYMPLTTPKQKIEQVAMFGKEYVDIKIEGDTFDDAYKQAVLECERQQKIFVHPFDDEKIIEGQATVGLEILQQTEAPIDYLILPVGGGGLAAGVSSIFKELSPHTKIIGVEPLGAPSMKTALGQNKPVELETINKFVDGAAVQKVGDKTFKICQHTLHKMITVAEGAICQTILDLYNKEAIVVEPAGALSITALEEIKEELRGKRVVSIISGSNNDISRMSEIKERAMLHAKLKHYFIVNFPQRAGALREFVVDILGPNDNIAFFEYQKKNSRENGPAVVGIELKSPDDIKALTQRMIAHDFLGEYLNDKPSLMNYLIS